MRAWWCALCLVACGPSVVPLEEHVDRELSFLAVGVQPAEEARRVQASLRQRGLRVVRRLDGPNHQALWARSDSASAVRVITRRGIVVAEDASLDDVLEPSVLQLLDAGSSDPAWVVVARLQPGDKRGCARVFAILADGSAVPQPIAVDSFGDRACVAHLRRGEGRLRVRVAWPTLSAGDVPFVDIPYRLEAARVGAVQPVVRRARPDSNLDWLEDTREGLPCAGDMAARQAAGVARAALVALSGEGVQAQLAAYSQCLGVEAAGWAPLVAMTRDHIARGWLRVESAAGARQAADSVLERAGGGQEEEGKDPR